MSLTFYAEFAGTVDEAKTFAAQHGLKRPNDISPNLLPYVSLRAKSGLYINDVIKKFADLGWDRASLITNLRR